MKDIYIIVPHGSVCDTVIVNGNPAQLMSTMGQPGMAYDLQTWRAEENPIGGYYLSYQLRLILPVPARIG